MPELPEVETVRRTLWPLIGGWEVAGVDLRRRDVVRGPSSPEALLHGDRIDRIERRGKQLALVGCSGRCVCAHLGMSGRLVVREGRPEAGRHDHCVWEVRRGRRRRWLVFTDPRRFGGLWAFRSREELDRERWDALGPDALTVTREALGERLCRASRPVKAALLDQGLVAGLGNIYVDEALFEARIGPGRLASRLSGGEVDRLHGAILRTLAEAVRLRGSTLRDYADALGEAGSYQASHAVYGRGGEPCVACGRALRTTVVGGRTTVHCVACQSRRGAASASALCTRGAGG